MRENYSKREVYAVKRMRLLDYLLQRGFEPFAEQPDATNWKYKNWLFKNTPELQTALKAYFEDINGNT